MLNPGIWNMELKTFKADLLSHQDLQPSATCK
jgi:hypothetical protein